MPGFNGTGPMGAVPVTGGRRGYFAPGGRDVSRCSFFGFGRSPRFGSAKGVGRDFRRRNYQTEFYPADRDFYSAADPKSELNTLKNRTNFIKNELEQIKSRIHELETDS